MTKKQKEEHKVSVKRHYARGRKFNKQNPNIAIAKQRLQEKEREVRLSTSTLAKARQTDRKQQKHERYLKRKAERKPIVQRIAKRLRIIFSDREHNVKNSKISARISR